MKDDHRSRKDAMSIPVMAPDKGRLIVIDAIDKAGKDTVAGALFAWLEAHGRKGFDYNAKGPDVPIPDEADFLVVNEPTYWGMGKYVREIIMKDKAFNAWSTAMAYALDREALYRQTVLPFLRAKPGRLVIQVRGLMCSLAYQTLQSEDEGLDLTTSQILELPGNQLELSRPPDLVLVLVLSPEKAHERLLKTGEEKDRFSDPRFQARVSLRYRAREVLEPFSLLGSKIAFIDADQAPEQVAASCTAELDALLNTTA